MTRVRCAGLARQARSIRDERIKEHEEMIAFQVIVLMIIVW